MPVVPWVLGGLVLFAAGLWKFGPPVVVAFAGAVLVAQSFAIAPSIKARIEGATLGGRRGRWACFALLLTVTPPILGFDMTLPIGGGSVRYADVLLVFVGAWVLPYVTRSRGYGVAQVLALVTAGLVLVALFHDAPWRWIIRDARPFAYMAVGVVLGIYLVRDRENWATNLRYLTRFMVVIAVLVLASQVTTEAIVGRSSATTLFYGNSSLELGSRRAQIETNPLALMLMCAAIGAAIAGLPLRRRLAGAYWPLLLASVVIVFLSYSRNSILALAATIACGILIPTRQLRLQRALHVLTVSTIAAIVLALPAYIVVESGVFASQLDTYSQRVVGGLSSDALAEDTSVKWRSTENRLAFDAFQSSPIVGTGLGVFYRDVVPGEPFTDEGGRLYVHDYWLWLLVKGGVVLAAVMLLVYGRCLWDLLFAGVRRLSDEDRTVPVAVGCGLVSILAAAVVAPWPLQPNMAAIIGAIIGAAATARSPEPAQPPSGSARRAESFPTRCP